MSIPGKYDYYRYFCETENKWIEDISSSVPNKCKNGDHQIKQDSLMILKKDIFLLEPIKNFSNDYSTSLDINDEQTYSMKKIIERISLLEQCAKRRGLLDFTS